MINAIIDHRKHIDYKTIEYSENHHGQYRVAKLYTPREAMKKAVHINYLANRAIGKATFQIIQRFMNPFGSGNARYLERVYHMFRGLGEKCFDDYDFGGYPGDSKAINKYGMAKIARRVLPRGVFVFDKECMESNLKDVINNYMQGKKACDPMYRYTTRPRIPGIDEDTGIIDTRMWLYPPEQAKGLKPQDRFLNKIRVAVFKTIYPIIRKYCNRKGKQYTWDEMAGDCYQRDISLPEKMEAYGVVVEEYRNCNPDDPRNKWVMMTDTVENKTRYRSLQKQVRYQRQFRNGTLDILHHDGIKRFYDKHLKPLTYIVDMPAYFAKVLKNPNAVTFKASIDHEHDSIGAVITPKEDLHRYLKHIGATVKD